MPFWKQLFLILCLLTLGEPSMAQSIDSSQSGSGAVYSETDAVLSGMDITRRVLGGDDSQRGAWPSVVALVTTGTSRLQDRFFCGGTLVARRWVMTAAHCMFNTFGVQYTAPRIHVIAGIHDLVEDAELTEVVVTNIILHPDYDNSKDNPPNDIALLELATEVDAPLGQLFAGESENYTGTIGYIVGWGATSYIDESNAVYPTTQQEAPVPLVSLATCNSPISYNGLIPVTQLCAGYAEGQIDTCVGDSGGPLYILENDQILQVGITSFGNGCGLENYYGIYTNVSHYIPWLGNYITVPEQSPELIASREASLNDAPDDSSGLFGAAMNPLCLLLLLGIRQIRKPDAGRTGMNRRKQGWACPGNRHLLVVSMALLMSACTVPAIEAQAGGKNAAEPHPAEKNSMSDDAHTLMLNSQPLRSGVDGLQLGASHAEIASSLADGPWQQPVCATGKTALRGTGRLFLTEHCIVEADGEVLLQGRQVHKLDLFLLDQQLVRLDVVLADSTAGEAATSADNDGLMELIEAAYGPAARAVPRAADTGQLSSHLWQFQDDQVRLYPEGSLHFVDGRLESSLPSLYKPAPPFDIE